MSQRLFGAAALAFLSVFSAATMAFTPDMSKIEDKTLSERYPEGTVLTREAADQLLTDVKAAKTRLEDEASYADRRCQENFFSNSCREDVRKAKMRQESRLLNLEAQAKRVVREDKARIEAEKQKQREAKKAAGPQGRRTVKKVEDKRQPVSNTRAQKRAEDVKKRQEKAAQRAAREEEMLKAHEKRLAERADRAARRDKARAERAQKEANR